MKSLDRIRGVCRSVGSALADTLVAIAGPMSGQYASAGDQIRKGAEMAIADINGAAACWARSSLEIGDDACDPKQAVAVANQMVNKKIAFMHGHWCSSSTIPASEVYLESNIPMATVSTNPKVTDRGLKNVFAIAGRDDQQGQVAGGYLADHFRARRSPSSTTRAPTARASADEIAKAMEGKGMKPALRESITAGEKDYSGLVAKLKAAGVEVLAYGGYHTEVALILRQAEQAKLKLTVLGGDTMSNTELVTAAGKAADNVLFTFGPDARKNLAAAPIVKKFRDAKIEAEGYVLYAYAAFQLFEQAAKKANSIKYNELEKSMRSGEFDTVLGKMSFDAKGATARRRPSSSTSGRTASTTTSSDRPQPPRC